MSGPPRVYDLTHRTSGAVVYRMILAAEMPGPVVPDWITATVADYEPADYEWRDVATGERVPAQHIRRFWGGER